MKGYMVMYDVEGIQKIRAAGRLADDEPSRTIRSTRGDNSATGPDWSRVHHLARCLAVDPGVPWVSEIMTTSINEVICHGIPDDTALEDGDIVNVDITVIRDGTTETIIRLSWWVTSTKNPVC